MRLQLMLRMHLSAKDVFFREIRDKAVPEDTESSSTEMLDPDMAQEGSVEEGSSYGG